MNKLKQFRKDKDEFFRSNEQSPLTHEQKHDFKGLSYFPHNPDLVFEVSLDEFPKKDVIDMQTSTGTIQSYQRYGKFNFNVGEQSVELTIYHSNGDFFLPFVDSLAGKDTYGAGRYLEAHIIKGNNLLIDFNYAYNPYCAYNARWSCPIPPAENRIEVPIKAGEKVFAQH